MAFPTTAGSAPLPTRRDYIWGVGLLLLIALVGLFLVKWQPYYLRTFTALTTHSIGASILTGTSAAPPAPSLGAAWNYATTYFLAIWQALVLGLLLAATLQTSIPRDLVTRLVGSATARSSALAGVVALPCMMCTCCSAPVVVGLRRTGASAGAATAFLLGNPTLNPAVLIFLVFTLGWQWALLRLVLGGVLVFGSAALVNRWSEPLQAPAVLAPLAAVRGRWPRRWLDALVRLAVQLLPEYVVIVGILGFARAFLFPAAGPAVGDSLGVLVGLALAGTLFVIPTAGEIPIIQTMLAFGVGAGPAGVLLLTLAPVSLPSLIMVGRVFSWRVLALLASSTVVVGLVAGGIALAIGL